MYTQVWFIANLVMWLSVELPFTVATPLADVLSPLKILPLGDSLTLGTGSSDVGSYRRPLLLLLQGQGYDIDFVGPLHTGTESGDPDNAGYYGALVSEVYDNIVKEQTVANYHPDYIFLLIGGNNMGNDNFAERAPDDLRTLLAEIFRQGPRTSVLVGTLIQTAKPDFNQRIAVFNEKLKGIVSDLSGQGRPISVADLSTAFDPAKYLKDGLHPNDRGYAKMAAAWFNSLKHKLPGSGSKLLQHNPHFQTTSTVPARTSNEKYVAMWQNHGMVIDLADTGGDLHAVSPLSMLNGIATTIKVQCDVQVSVTFRVRDSLVTTLCPTTVQQLHVRFDSDNKGLHVHTTAGDSTWRVYQYLFTPRNEKATLSFQVPGEVAGVCGPSIADVVIRQD